MGLKLVNMNDTFGEGAEKLNFNDQWLRDLIISAVHSGYEKEITSATSVWVVDHNLRTKVLTYLCTDLDGNQYLDGPTGMKIDSENRITITWPSSRTGRVKLTVGMSGWTYPGLSEVGWPDDHNWDDGVARIFHTDSIATAIDKINTAALPGLAVGENLQSAYNADVNQIPPKDPKIAVDLGYPIHFYSNGPSSDILYIEQMDSGGIPLRIGNAGISPSIDLSGATTSIRASGSPSFLLEAPDGDVILSSGQDILVKLGDSSGTYGLVVTDNTGMKAASINSNGIAFVKASRHTEYSRAAAFSLAPQASEAAIAQRPTIQVFSEDNHLYYIDPDGNQYDLVDAAISERRATDIFTVTNDIIVNHYVDLSARPIERSEMVFLNGLALSPGMGYDYTVGDPPLDYRIYFDPEVELAIGSQIRVTYNLDAEAEEWEDEVFVPGPNQYVVLSQTPVYSSEYVFVNGVGLTRGNLFDYYISGNTIVFMPGVKSEQAVVRVKYRYKP